MAADAAADYAYVFTQPRAIAYADILELHQWLRHHGTMCILVLMPVVRDVDSVGYQDMRANIDATRADDMDTIAYQRATAQAQFRLRFPVWRNRGHIGTVLQRYLVFNADPS
jgi:hypothetical protein